MAYVNFFFNFKFYFWLNHHIFYLFIYFLSFLKDLKKLGHYFKRVTTILCESGRSGIDVHRESAHTDTRSKYHTDFHNGERSSPNLNFQGQVASKALVNCASKVWWNHTSFTSHYCTAHSVQTLCLTNIWKQPAGIIEMTQWASMSTLFKDM